MRPRKRTDQASSARERVTRAQWLTLLATTLAWCLDGFDGSLFTLVVGPAMTEILATGGVPADPDTVKFYSGVAISIYLLGWALGAVVLGVLADYLGRLRVLTAGILVFAVFTALTALATDFWQVAVFRFLAGVGSGVEYPVGATLIAEVWTNRHRARAASVMASGYAAGYFLASVTYGLIGGFGWRATIAVTLVPALLVFVIRRFLKEPETAIAARRQRRAQRESPGERPPRFTLVELFSGPLRRTTVLAMVLCAGTLLAFWSITTWAPQMIRDLPSSSGDTLTRVALGTALLNLGGFLGYASWGFIADALGRRPAFVVSIACMWVGSVVLFPWDWGYGMYLVVLPVIGFGVFGAFSGCAVWFPELFAPPVRATAMSFTNSFGRILTAPGPVVAGVVAASWFGGSLPQAVMVVASIGLVALVGVALLPETRGRMVHGWSPDPDPPRPRTSM